MKNVIIKIVVRETMRKVGDVMRQKIIVALILIVIAFFIIGSYYFYALIF